MSKKKAAPPKSPPTPKESLLILPVTPEQIALLAPAVQEFQAAQAKVNLVFVGLLASHGRSQGSLVALEGGPQPKVTIRVYE